MVERGRLDRGRRLAWVVGVSCLVVAAAIELDASSIVRELLAGGYGRRVAGLLERGDVLAAYEELTAATLLDEEAIALVRRTRGSGAVSGVIRRDTKLRSSIGYQLGVRLDERPSNEDLLPLLDAAIDNQSMLARLDPSDARTRVWLGSLYMRRGEAAGAPIDFVRAARQFQLALAIDPDVPAAAKALQGARRRSLQ